MRDAKEQERALARGRLSHARAEARTAMRELDQAFTKAHQAANRLATEAILQPEVDEEVRVLALLAASQLRGAQSLMDTLRRDAI